MCFSLVFACLSVHLSVWGLDLRSLARLRPPPRLPAPPWEQNLEQVWFPILVGASRRGLRLSLHSGSRVLCVCMCVRACMYTGSLCARMYKGGHVTGGAGGAPEAGPAWVASSQVDSPQVSGRCDGVALRAELLGTLRGERGGLWTHPCCTRERPGLQHVVPTGCVLGPRSCLPVCPGWAGTGGLCEQAGLLLCWGDARIKPPGQPRSGSPGNENKAGPAVAASALTRLHAAFDQDTEPTSRPFIAVSGRHFNGCSGAKNRSRSRRSLETGGGGARAGALVPPAPTQPPPEPGLLGWGPGGRERAVHPLAGPM